MEKYYCVSVVTPIFGIVLFGMSLTVSRLRSTKNVPAPAIAGDPVFERAFRAHANTVEWTPIFLPQMWLLAAYWSGTWAAILGAVWVVGRIVYFIGYIAEAEKSYFGMSIQAAAALALTVGSLGRIAYEMVQNS